MRLHGERLFLCLLRSDLAGEIVPTLCVGMPLWTLCVRSWDAERPGLHSHAERGNDLVVLVELTAENQRLTTRQNCHRHGARSGCASGGRPPRVRSRIPR
ncbi:hypothetical protein EIY71_08145 [Pseudomonas sp. CH235]|nr:hypothetical protein EIY71_08145 [Pseudomonas sp. CH235]